MKESVLLRRIGIFILFTILFEFGIMYFFIRLSENDARVIDQAGIVRGASQRYVKLNLAREFDKADQLSVELDKVVSALQNGDVELNISKLNDKQFQDKLSNISVSWSELKQVAGGLKNETTTSAKLLQLSEDYFVLTDEAVKAAESASKNKVIISEIVLSIILGFELVALFLLRAITKKRIIRPLNIISTVLPKAAAGDLTQRLPMVGGDEFGEIALVFNKFASRQQEFINSLELKVKEKTKDLEIKIKEIEKEKNRVEVEKLQSEKLALENEKFKLALENATDHVVITDAQGTLLYANIAAQKITGYTIEEMIGQKAGKLWGGLMDRSFYEQMWKTIKVEKKAFVGKLKNKRKNGEVYDAEISVAPILDKLGEPLFFVGIERDITQQTAIDKAKIDFVSVVSHQLRTPLTAINWYSEILMSKDYGKLNKKQIDYIQEIMSGNRRMVELVNNLLNMSRLELGTLPVHLEDSDLCKILDEVVKEASVGVKKSKLKISLVCSVKSVPVSLDVSLTKFIFQNFITNAIKYSKPAGSVKVEIYIESGNVVVAVKDNGIGIPIADQKHMFGKFFRAANASINEAGGSGLGLYIVKLVSDFIGGKVWFDSKEGVGSNFYFSMPVSGMKTNIKS